MTDTNAAATVATNGLDVVLLEPIEIDEDAVRKAAEAVRRRRLSLFAGRHDQDYEPRDVPADPVDEAAPTPPVSG